MVHAATASMRLSSIGLVLYALVATTAAQADSVLLDFTSPHCAPCQRLRPTVEKLQAEGFPVQFVDVTRNSQLAAQFGVTRVPCLVLVTDGREQGRLQGVADYQQIRGLFETAHVAPRTAVAQAKPLERGQSPDSPWDRPLDNAAPSLDPRTQVPRAPVSGLQAEAMSSASPTGMTPPAIAYVAPGDFEQQLLRCSVRIKVEDASGHSFGTGTIIDTFQQDALVVTCGHLFRGEAEKGTITIEVFEPTPQGVRVLYSVPGHLESFDLTRDIGLVSFKPRGAVTVAKVAAQPASRVNDPVWSVGCDRGADPTVRSSHVTDLNRYHGPDNLEVAGAPVEGRSGGGLFNRQGELIGVCFAADPAADEGLYGAIPSIHAELDRLGLSRIYDPASATAASTPVVPAAERRLAPLPAVSGGLAVFRGQDPGSSVAAANPASPMAVSPATAPAQVASPVERLSAPERAALQEIAQRASEGEVVCIVRPRDGAGSSEVIHLDRVSPEFLAALRSLGSSAPAPR
jgi:thiol-disulfide isomerase/thioredoxin